jgi:transposase
MTYPLETRKRFNALVAQGKSINEISNELVDVKRDALNRWSRELKVRGTMHPLKPSGRPIKHSEREKRLLFRRVSLEPSLSIAQLTERAGMDACHKTVVKILKERQILSIVAAKRPSLTHAHAINRLRFANNHLNKSVRDWKRWTFSDECSVHLDCAEGNRRFIIKRSDRFKPDFVVGKKQQGGGKLMIWSFISPDGVGPLLFIEGGINARLYTQLLQRYVLPHVLEHLDENGEGQIYMDDGASSHDAEEVIEFCAEKGIQRPYWPANSPDINPIEHIWGWIKNKLTAMAAKPRNIAQLKEILTEIWYNIPQQSILKLYEGMPKRIETVRAVNGWNTNY